MKTRRGIGTTTVAAVALVVIIVVAAGAYFALSGASPKSNTTTSSTPEQSTSTTTSSVATSTTTTTTSTAVSNSSASQVSTKSSTSQATFPFTMSVNAPLAVLSPGDSTNYVVLTVNPTASGTETVSINGTVSGGLGLSFEFNSVTLAGGQAQTDQVFLGASPSQSLGNFTLNVTAATTSQVQSASIPVRVVQHLVYLSYYAFDPTNVTVPKGSTVYFFNTDAPHSWCGETDSGDKTISFTSIVSTTSPVISSFTLWGITLTQGGTYTYMDTEHPTSGTGTIVVD